MSEDPDNTRVPDDNAPLNKTDEAPKKTSGKGPTPRRFAPASSFANTTALVGIAAVLTLGLAGYFTFVATHDDNASNNNRVISQTQPPTETAQRYTEPEMPATEAPAFEAAPEEDPQELARKKIISDSVAAKESAIFRDENRALYDAYIDKNGNEVEDGGDFAVHVGLFNNGNVSILIADGPHAGTRVGLFAVDTSRAGAHITIERVGKIVKGEDSSTNMFKALSRGERTLRTASMRTPEIAGKNIVKPNQVEKFDKYVLENRNTSLAFSLVGTPEIDGVFSVVLFNDDTYSINLNTGEFSVDSVFMFHPDWQERVENECNPHPDVPCNIIDRNKIPVIKGVVPKAPTPSPRAAIAPS